MNRKYQVFISSTYEDLKVERKAIFQALLESNCIPAGMELFPASCKRSLEIIQKEIDDSDYFILVIAGKYGSCIKEKSVMVSYTEKEFDHALKNGKPIMAFIHSDIASLPYGKVERTAAARRKLDRFKQRIMSSNINVAFWTNEGELISKIKSSVQEIIKSSPTCGWIRGRELGLEVLDDSSTNAIIEVFKHWKLARIFRTRAEKNTESDPKLEHHKIKQLDGVSFGLSSFRSVREQDVLKSLNNGMQMRLIVMNPQSKFIIQRAVEENVPNNSIARSVLDLVDWAKRLNVLSTSGKIEIKYYNSMTLDFYWRVDDELYVGPYLYGVVSQQTITYKYVKGGRGFEMYSAYFETLWNNPVLCTSP